MKLFKLALIFVAALYLSGCASGAKMKNMTFQGEQKSYFDVLNDNIELSNVSGGQKTNPLWTSEISSEAFSGAVRGSLQAQGLLSDDGRYKLVVNMLKVDQPIFGLDFEVTTHVQYLLTDSATQSIVFDETIIAPHTATFKDAFVAVKRLRLANEGAGRKNIEALLDKLSALQIDKNEVSLVE
jgi:hypothetical protein